MMNNLVSFYKNKEGRREDKQQAKTIKASAAVASPCRTSGTREETPMLSSHEATTAGRGNAMADLAHDSEDDEDDEEDEEDETPQEQRLRQEAYETFARLPRYFSAPPATMPPPLPRPVLIPQRRQGDRLRGFQLLYAPQLEQCAVSEQEFTIFLNRLNTAIGFDNKIKLFNFAIDVGSLAAPSWEIAIATLGTQTITTVSGYVKSRAKSKAYIEHANERLFNPRGLEAKIALVSQLDRLPNSPFAEEAPALSSTEGYGETPESPAAQPPTSATTHDGVGQSSETKSRFQFSPGSQFVLDANDPKAQGGFLNLAKTPIEYDPFDYGPSFIRIRPEQYYPLRPSQYKEPATNLIDRAAESVEKYNVWQDRLPAKKCARREKKRNETIDKIRAEKGEEGVDRFLEDEARKQQEARAKKRAAWQRFQERHKIVLVITNLDEESRRQVQAKMAAAPPSDAVEERETPAPAIVEPVGVAMAM